MMNINRYIIPKARYLARMKTKDGGRLRKKLIETLIVDAVEYYELDSVAEAKIRKLVTSIVQANLGSRTLVKETVEEAKVTLPKDWKEVIKPRKKLSSYKQLSEKEKEYHRHYCSKEKCAFGPNEVCPVCRFSK